MPKDVLDKATQELKKLEAMPPMSAESTVSRNYLDWLLAVPWKKKSKEIRSIDHAEKILNEDHYGLPKIKDRILEFLAVRQLVKNPKGSILCFVGPPGVGKTSLGMSIAKATGRQFVRMSLGGVRDEAEIRGHRRTYIGSLPGQIIQSMKKAGTKNPVIMLDEIDKMASDFRGDPHRRCSRCLIPSRTRPFRTTTWTSNTTCRRCCSSPRPTCCTPSPGRCRTAWKSCGCTATPRSRSWKSPSSTW